MTDGDPESFDAFPRGRLSLKWSRRQLLSALATERRVLSEHRHDGAAIKLPDLGSVPDELLELMTPKLVAGCRIVEDRGSYWGTTLMGGRPIRLFSSTSGAALAFAHFDGEAPLGVIARQLADDTGWESGRAFAYTRGLFLHLVSLGFCLPKR